MKMIKHICRAPDPTHDRTGLTTIADKIDELVDAVNDTHSAINAHSRIIMGDLLPRVGVSPTKDNPPNHYCINCACDKCVEQRVNRRTLIRNQEGPLG